MIKILHIGFSENYGGVENLVMNYYRNIDKNKFHFDFLDIYSAGIAFENEINALGGTIYRLPNYKRNPIKAARKMDDILNTNNYNIVHIHMQSAANLMPVLVALHNKKVKVIAHCHSSSTPKGIVRKIMHYINIMILRKLDIEKWACGELAGKWMWGDVFENENIIVNAIDTEIFIPNKKIREKIREECGFQDSDRIIGFVGRFGDEKNTLFLIKVLGELLKFSNKYKLLVVGTGKQYDEFKKEVGKRKIVKNVYCAGTQKNLNEWYQAMDVFLLPSFFEGFPMVGLEAQASGLPCFFSDRISSEIDVSNTSHFVSIDSGGEQEWACEIHKIHNQRILRNPQIPYTYGIKYTVKTLEDKYEILKTEDSYESNKCCRE